MASRWGRLRPAWLAPLAAQTAIVEVEIDNFVFGPERLTVKAGTTVTWINHDDIPHTVAAKERPSSSGDGDDQLSAFTSSTPGEYSHFSPGTAHDGNDRGRGDDGSSASQ